MEAEKRREFGFASKKRFKQNLTMGKALMCWVVIGIFLSGCSQSKDQYEAKTFSKELLKKAEAGDAKAQLQLGGAYQEGRGIEKNRYLALEWIKKSADQGYPRALAILGQRYFLGDGVEKDEKKALALIEEAAVKGLAEAQFDFSALLTDKKKYPEAYGWIKKSAEQGFPQGQYYLGQLYERGQGCQPDQQAAIFWYKKAADSGNVEAARKLGAIYNYGKGVEKNESEAIHWYQKAGKLGDTNAAFAIKAIWEALKLEQDLPEDKRKMLRKSQQELGRRLSEMERTGRIPKPDPSKYEILWTMSKEHQRFYVEEILLSEDESLIGIFSADMKLDPNGEWVLGTISPKFVRVEDLKNQEKNYRFKLTPSRGWIKLIQPSETGRKKEYSRFMKDVFAQNGKTRAENTFENWEYKNEGQGITITRYIGDETDVVVPSEIQSIPVKKLGMAFKDFGELRSVKIPDGVTEIGFWAFGGCTNLASVKLGKGLKKIGGYAFPGCGNLKEIYFPDGLEQIGEEAFSGCAGLKRVSLPNSINMLGFNAFFKCTGLEQVKIGWGVKTIPSHIFYGCGKLQEVLLPEGLTTIEEGAFQYCGNLAKITIPNSVKSIALGAFDACPELSEESLKQIKAVEGR